MLDTTTLGKASLRDLRFVQINWLETFVNYYNDERRIQPATYKVSNLDRASGLRLERSRYPCNVRDRVARERMSRLWKSEKDTATRAFRLDYSPMFAEQNRLVHPSMRQGQCSRSHQVQASLWNIQQCHTKWKASEIQRSLWLVCSH